ncbi:hypothetical protein HHL19_31355 [Streptomyces sp. R302]|uniref:hypothetical protein n=1 Tax=unclassified Streptomyces TaxID=2593676 RepID=UPI00145EB1B9|nr:MULTISPECIES: hypothetical protein [unclassified Streptomyces]NML53775.1 hypothetical protein [Streptomyces sp. R301]NML83034.1 hypothetical protein [Streptomyces sp. R302]
MTTRRLLSELDLLRSRAFPASPARSGDLDSGPGFHVAALATSEDFWEADAERREAVEEQYEAERDGLAAVLTARWGEPDRMSLWSLHARSMEGEELPEPWGVLCAHVPDLVLWRVDARWTGLGVSQWDKELPFQLLAVVTEVDPP